MSSKTSMKKSIAKNSVQKPVVKKSLKKGQNKKPIVKKLMNNKSKKEDSDTESEDNSKAEDSLSENDSGNDSESESSDSNDNGSKKKSLSGKKSKKSKSKTSSVINKDKDKKIEESDDEEETKGNINYYNKLKVLIGKSTKYMETIEDIDVNTLNYILENKEEFKEQIDKFCTKYDKKKRFENDDEEQEEEWGADYCFNQAAKLLKKSRNGQVKVVYRQRKSQERFYATRGLSLQSLARPIRQSIAPGYIDIDIKNAGPTILKFMCDENGIKCPILTKYCKDRKKFWHDNGVNEKDGKNLFISIMNGGKNFVKKCSPDYNKFKEDEIVHIFNKITKLHPKLYEEHEKERNEKGKDKNADGSFVSKIIRDIENKILQKMYEFFKKPADAVLCFDGLMLKMDSIHDKTLRKCESFVYEQLHIKIELSEKPFDDALDLSDCDIPKYTEESFSHYMDYQKMVDEYVELEVIEEWLNNTIYFLENKENPYLVKSEFISPIIINL